MLVSYRISIIMKIKTITGVILQYYHFEIKQYMFEIYSKVINIKIYIYLIAT